ncbi:MAG: glycosyltransferase family 4 protein [Bacteroidales bacterium]
MKKNSILIYTNTIDNLITGSENIAGVEVFMHSWASVFIQNNWSVYSFTLNNSNRNKVLDNIFFIKWLNIPYFNILFTPLFLFYVLLRIKPDIIFSHCASRDLFFISFLCRLMRIKNINFLASDTDVEIDKELIKSGLDRRMFRIGLSKTFFIVAQNEKQKKLLKQNYNRDSLIIPTIRNNHLNNLKQKSLLRNKILWVANFRSLKRPEWFIQLAKQNPLFEFVMVGGPIETELFETCRQNAEKIPNLQFMGALNWQQVNFEFNKANLLVCTSVIEGFPNTFIQAWDNNLPIISTFDPSNVISKNKLGFVVDTFEQLSSALVEIMSDKELYNLFQKNIKMYFEKEHNGQQYYNDIVKICNIPK